MDPTGTYEVSKAQHEEYVARRLAHERSRKEHLQHGGWKNKLLCVMCLEFFGASNSTALYCSRKCAYEARKLRRSRLEAECKLCHATFEPNGSRAKFCGNKCRQAAYRRRRSDSTALVAQSFHRGASGQSAEVGVTMADCSLVIQPSIVTPTVPINGVLA